MQALQASNDVAFSQMGGSKGGRQNWAITG